MKIKVHHLSEINSLFPEDRKENVYIYNGIYWEFFHDVTFAPCFTSCFTSDFTSDFNSEFIYAKDLHELIEYYSDIVFSKDEQLCIDLINKMKNEYGVDDSNLIKTIRSYCELHSIEESRINLILDKYYLL